MGIWFQDLPKIKKFIVKDTNRPILAMLQSENFPSSSLMKFNNESGELEEFKVKVGFLTSLFSSNQVATLPDQATKWLNKQLENIINVKNVK